MPPRGRSAGAQAPSRVPRGPSKVIASVGTGAHSIDACHSKMKNACACRPGVCSRAACGKLASIDDATAPLTPSNPRRRIASLRVMIPSAWSSATSSARYRCISVMVASPLGV